MMISILCFTVAQPLNPRRDERRPFLTAKRHILLAVVRSAYKVPPDVVHVILVLYEKERRDLGHEARVYMILTPADFSEFITGEPGEYHFIFKRSLALNGSMDSGRWVRASCEPHVPSS